MTTSVTSATYPNSHAFAKTLEFCYVLKKLIKSCKGDRKFSLEQAYELIYPNLCDNVLSIEESATTCPIDLKKSNITNSLKQFVVNYAKENIAKVNIFLKDPFVKRYVREEKITVNTFIGTIGGLLGLFLGFSVISIAEVVYLITLSIHQKMACSSKKIENSPPNSLHLKLRHQTVPNKY